MIFEYDYKGVFNALLTEHITAWFDVDKLGLGKFHQNTVVDRKGETSGGWIYEPQALAALFERIRMEKRITIVKKTDQTFDAKFKHLLKKNKKEKFFLYFSKTEDDGVNYFHKDVTFTSPHLESTGNYQDAGINFSVFTITGKKVTTGHLSGKDGDVSEADLGD